MMTYKFKMSGGIYMLGMILIDDRRYAHTKNYLKGKGHIFCEADTPSENLDFMIFPFADETDENMYDNAYFAAARPGTAVFSGIRNTYLEQKCLENGLAYHVMMDNSQIAAKNAVPTSEGVIAYLVANREMTIAAGRMLVIGYGICGSDLARRLKGLDADVYALVRNRERELLAKGDGVTPVYLHGLFEHGFDVIVNTVPRRVLTDEMVRRLGGSVLLIDIASKPYGFDMALARSLNEKSALLPGIPGKYAVKTSGEILGQYINDILRGR
jgi:dipicolinate synthase subunit A